MKKKLLLFLLGLLSAGSAWADNDSYFTMGYHDTIWINPNITIDSKVLPVKAVFQNKVDAWNMQFILPAGMQYHSSIERAGMTIPYINSSGENVTLSPTLTVNATSAILSSGIYETGYWYYNGILVPYGTVKWDAGSYSRMFDIELLVSSTFFSSWADTTAIKIDGHLSSTYDMRDNSSGMTADFFKRISVIVGNRPGDVNGDDKVDNSDVSLIVGYALHPENYNWDEYQLAAADIDGSGVIDVTDATLLIQIIMSA